MSDDDRLYFRQLLSGREFARQNQVATQMVNFVYLIGDRQTGEAAIIDPAYGVADLLGIAAADGMRVVAALATHHHADHVGGSMMGYAIEGIPELLALEPVKIHANRHEVDSIRQVSGASDSDFVGHDSGDVLRVGDVEIQFLHTPGHTPGSQCFLVDKMLVSGDTLFLEGCGRTDLPGSDSLAMYESLRRLATLPDDVAVFPGHRYSVASSGTMEAVKEINMVMKPTSQDEWMTHFGR